MTCNLIDLQEVLIMSERERFERQYYIFLKPEALPDNSLMFKLRDEWLKQVLADLVKIEADPIGNLLLRSIAYHRHLVLIRPVSIDPGADCVGDSVGPAGLLEASIDFTPQPTTGHQSLCRLTPISSNSYQPMSDEILFHELVHALRRVSGKRASTRVDFGKGLAFFDWKEEFIAVVVQGVYQSRNRRPVRASHHGHYEIDPELNGDYRFFQVGSEAYKYIKEFCEENPGFTTALACMDAPFNPMRAYYAKPALAKSISENSPVAAERDRIMPKTLSTINAFDELASFISKLMSEMQSKKYVEEIDKIVKERQQMFPQP